MIYLDNAATTKAYKSAADIAAKYYTDCFFNPSALYSHALDVGNDIAAATEKLARLFGADKTEIVYTSCATESNNFALECGYKNKKGNLVISGGEHASVYEAAMKLKNSGRDVRIVPLDKSGSVDTNKLIAAVDSNTALVSVLHCSNETGAVNDVKELCRAVKLKNKNAVFHSDGVQAAGKHKIDLHALGIDLYSISAHKIGGLKGIGALFIKKGFNMQPLIVGGGQQGGRRSGTENVGGIISFAEAAERYIDGAKSFDAAAMRQYMAGEILSEINFATINGSKKNNSGYILSLSFDGIKGEVLSHLLEEKNIIVGLGAACSTHAKQSRVLAQLGLSAKQADGSIRISFCPENTFDEIKYATTEIISAAKYLKDKIDG